ncbi:hypothetical protein B0H14DRAFT_2660394, partial [Mycena olivaceomarginata]
YYPRVSRRCFASRAVLFNASSSTPSAKPVYPRPTVGKGAYSGISIEDPQSAPQQPAQGTTWSDHPVGGMATQPPTDPTEKWRAHSRAIVPTLQKLQIADAYSGRHVKVWQGKFAEAVRDFEKILARNRVRFTYRAAERHEKKGPKRRRIRSEQWRKHFANQVRKNVQLVHKIRRRGV